MVQVLIVLEEFGNVERIRQVGLSRHAQPVQFSAPVLVFPEPNRGLALVSNDEIFVRPEPVASIRMPRIGMPPLGGDRRIDSFKSLLLYS